MGNGRSSGKAALVIGAGSGLGQASAIALAQDGARVMAADIDEGNAAATAAAIREAGGEAAHVVADAIDEAAVKAAIEATVAAFGKLDVLVNSVGFATPATDDGWHLAIDVYLKGPYYACKHALPEMVKAGAGAIVNIGSIASLVGSIHPDIEGSGYPSAKHGLVGLTKTIALANAKKNIRANVLSPGYIRSAMTKSLFKDDDGRKLISETLRVPMDRWGEPHEIGKVAAFLASDDASFITGQVLAVDGGFLAR